MNPIKLYFAGPFQEHIEKSTDKINRILCSYFYKRWLYEWFNYAKEKPLDFIIDSGAYSIWSKNGIINLLDYLSFCKGLLSDTSLTHHRMKFVNLDVIPGKRGVIPSKEDIDKAASQGFKNLETFIDNNILPIHVFHQGESFKWIDKIVEKIDYMGISPTEDSSVRDRKRWINDVFSYLYKNNYKVKTHGFGIFIKEILLEYPWTSVDTPSCRRVARTGSIYYPKGGFSNPDYSKMPYIIPISKEQLNKNKILFLSKMEDIFKKDGFNLQTLKESFHERMIVNIKYFVGLEKGLNELKKKMVYKPTIKLME